MSNIYDTRRPEPSGSSTIKGSRAGESFKSKKEADEESDWNEYKKKKNLSFAAQKDQGFRDWQKKKREDSEAAKKKMPMSAF